MILYVFKLFCTFAHKVDQTWFVLHETWQTIYYLVYILGLKLLELKIIVICYKLRAKFRFYGFLSFFGTYVHKITLSLFVLHETWHTTFFGIYYYFEVVSIENNCHMLEIF